MADKTAIQWTNATWNMIAGCSLKSPGCTHCYAMGEAARQIRCAAGLGKATHYAGTVETVKGRAVWTGKITSAPDHVWERPLHWKRPRLIFANSMSDIFHEKVPDEWIDRAFAVMALAPQHQFQLLTKRSARMRAYMTSRERGCRIGIGPALDGLTPPPRPWSDRICKRQAEDRIAARDRLAHWPLPNVWLGVSTEDQERANERIPDLLQTPAGVRFISAEPLLGPIDLTSILHNCGNGLFGDALRWHHMPYQETRIYPALDWVIAGGESDRGAGHARPMHPAWALSLRDQCDAAGVPFFFKQWGEWICSNEPSLEEIEVVKPNCAVHKFDDETVMWRLGSSKTGNKLDGREHNAFPASAT